MAVTLKLTDCEAKWLKNRLLEPVCHPDYELESDKKPRLRILKKVKHITK